MRNINCFRLVLIFTFVPKIVNMKRIFFLLVIITQYAYGQTVNKAEINSIKNIIGFLADDKLEGRRTGSNGEKLAYEFIIKKFTEAGLHAKGNNNDYLQEFEVKDGKAINKQTSLLINQQPLKLDSFYFPLAYSANIEMLEIAASDESIVYYNTAPVIEQNKSNPHFDLKEDIYNAAKKTQTENKKLFIIYNSSNELTDDITFEPKDKAELLKIPVIYYTKKEKLAGKITLTISISEKTRYGHNVAGYIDNKAPYTIILGAHYDHLGYGEDHNSLYAGSSPMIHNGADDNASGVAALLVLSKWLKSSGLKKYNYAFLAFSGEELGLYGSKYFTEHSTVDLTKVNYMLNMDMLGRLNDSTHGLTIGGYGTSPAWADIVHKDDTYFKIKTDSSGTGPSDHTSFYKKDIPVLYFFTGSHSDYHKPSDDADKINYEGEAKVISYIKQVLTTTDKMDKIGFLKTKDPVSTKSSFKVTLGIMPDYTYDGDGVRVDAVIDNRPAQKAGIKTGDVIFQLGEHGFNDIQTYMQALNKFSKGEATKVKLRRGTEVLVVDLVF